MKIGKFLDLIKKGENERIEFKSRISKDIGEEICALGNSNGGHIFIGVDGEGNIVGCNPKKAKEQNCHRLLSFIY